MQPLPRITQRGPAGLILWLRRDQPAIYSQLVATVPEVAQIETVIQQQESGGLGFFAAIGSAIMGFAKNAMPKLISALPQIASTAVDVAGQVYVAQQQKKLIDAQLKQAQLNQAPLATAQVPNQFVSTINPVTGARQAQPAVALRPSMIPGVPDIALYSVGALALIFLAKRNKVL